jgi:hypothetical protein
MNSNNWFNNATGVDRPFSNANQWAASIGGPIRKDSTFFFVDTEGFKFVLPNVFSVTTPTPAFANAVLNNIQTKQPAEYNAYKQLFGLWANAPGSGGGEPVVNSSACNALSLTGFNPATQNCAQHFNSSSSTLGNEWILAFRVDQRIGTKDNAYFRYKGDHGLQPTYLDPISHAFDALSRQPSYDMQFSETHVFGPRVTNSYMMTLSHYVAQFQQNVQNVNSAWPYGRLTTGSPVTFTSFNPQSSFPQGRNITQYQFIDDVAYIHGRHNLKFGANFRRYDVSDHNFFYTYPRVYFGTTSNGLQRFADGLAYRYTQSLNLANDVPIAMWGLGMYAQDEWNVRSNLKLTLALRAERNSNPVCQFNCFANFNGPVNSLPSFTNSNPGSVPYSNDIQSGLHQAYPGVDAILLSPRIGFNWSPTPKTVVSGGFMLAYDNPPAGLVDNLLANPPISVQFRVQPTAGTAPFDPNGAPAVWNASASAFSLNKTFSQISSQLSALGASFAAPSFTSIQGTIHAPRWKEWNFMIQRQLTNDTVLAINYVGNSGDRILYSNPWPNAFDQFGLYPGVAGVPANQPVPNYGIVTQWQNGAISNSNGLSVILTKRFSKMFMAHFSYTWAHNLDEVSNGGVFTYGDSVLGQINPLSLRTNNYGNSDYDIRHNFSGDFIFNPTFHVSGPLKYLVNGWELGGKVFWRTGLPFSVLDGNSALGNGGGSILATPLGQGWGQSTCGASNAFITGDEPACLNSAAFLDSSTIDHFTGWSPQTRNQLRGPHFFDVDLSLYKNFKIKERVGFAVGAMAFNAFNHPNFGLPGNDISDPTGFGRITAMQGSPLSPYGTFLGFDSSVRVVQLTGKITF